MKKSKHALRLMTVLVFLMAMIRPALAAVTDAAINAHGGGILYHKGIYYLYGEVKSGPTRKVPGSSWENYRVDAGGVSCYSSKDLKHWTYRGLALPANKTDSGHDLHISKVIERPKVIYNKRTKKFVMWMHIDSQDYALARSGVAVSDAPAGPFRYLGSVRPNGHMARDMTVFVDDDGKAYQFYSSEDNKTMYICLLSADYLKHTKREKRILVGKSREAPAVFKANNKYYLVTSGCTGWMPNGAECDVAGNVWGEWRSLGNPCRGRGADKTFNSQSTFVLALPGKDQFLFMADRWHKLDLARSTYLWLPFRLEKKGLPVIRYRAD